MASAKAFVHSRSWIRLTARQAWGTIQLAACDAIKTPELHPACLTCDATSHKSDAQSGEAGMRECVSSPHDLPLHTRPARGVQMTHYVPGMPRQMAQLEYCVPEYHRNTRNRVCGSEQASHGPCPALHPSPCAVPKYNSGRLTPFCGGQTWRDVSARDIKAIGRGPSPRPKWYRVRASQLSNRVGTSS